MALPWLLRTDGRSHNFKDRTGEKYGRLTVLYEDTSPNRKEKQIYWVCQCDCGKLSSITSGRLATGNTQSCGCLAQEKRTLHGMWKSKMYRIWQGLIQRCHNAKSPHYESYGGRGIFVCEEWRQSFTSFKEWNYSKFPEIDDLLLNDYQLERINNDGPYAPWNCRWATRKEQGRNTRKTKWIVVNGERISAAEAIERYSVVKPTTFWSRIRLGWDAEKALFTPANRNTASDKYTNPHP